MAERQADGQDCQSGQAKSSNFGENPATSRSDGRSGQQSSDYAQREDVYSLSAAENSRLPPELFGIQGLRVLGLGAPAHNPPAWALTDAGLAAVALGADDAFLLKRGGRPANYARRVSVAYLYFRVGLSADRVARCLGLRQTAVEKLIQKLRARGAKGDYTPNSVGTFQAESRARLFVRERDASLFEISGESEEDKEWRRIEKKLAGDVAEQIRWEALAEIGAVLRPRRRGALRYGAAHKATPVYSPFLQGRIIVIHESRPTITDANLNI